ncbi:MAG: hypothetical protein MZW92_03075 [Comamonadaceae bacterium]|nr:hypothetical protein [Comamonadaceae bacterium]
MFFEYHPQVVHDLHESLPLLQTWNGTGPFNTNLDPILLNEWFAMSFAELSALTSAGMPGVWTWGFSDGWAHCFLDSIGVNHNSIGRGYETFGNGTAETVERELQPERGGATRAGRRRARSGTGPCRRRGSSCGRCATTRTTCRAAAWPRSTMRPSTRRRCCATSTARATTRGRRASRARPYAFAIADGPGRPAARGRHGRPAHRPRHRGRTGDGAVQGRGRGVRGGDVRGAARPAVPRLRRRPAHVPQTFPTDAVYEPYDDVSWALTVHYGLEAKRIDDAKIMDVAAVTLEPVAAGVKTQGAVNGKGPVYLLKDTGQEGLLALRARLAAFRVEIAEKAFKAGDKDYPAGSWIIADQKGLADALGEGRGRAGYRFRRRRRRCRRASRGTNRSCRASRVWHTWADTEAVGWIRFVLDREKVPYAYIRDEDVRAGRLRGEVRRRHLRPQLPRAAGPDPRHRQEVRAAGLHEDERDAEPGRARRVGGHHRRHRLAGGGQDRGVPRARAACSSRSATARRCRSRAGWSATSTGRAGRSSRRAPSSRSSSRGRTIRWPTARPR